MSKKILVIEDEPAVLANIQTILREEGFSVILAHGGKEGVSVAQTQKPDLIICDIMMPGFSGYDVLETLSKDPKTRIIPFIFLTAKVEREDVRRGMELGADDYITKPFSINTLLKAVDSRLQRFETIKSEIISSGKNEENKDKYQLTDTILVKSGASSQVVKIGEIKFITAENQYTSIKLISGKRFIIRKSISAWESILPLEVFIRSHRSQIINTEYIIKISRSKSDSYNIFLTDEEDTFPVSKRYASRLRNKLK